MVIFGGHWSGSADGLPKEVNYHRKMLLQKKNSHNNLRMKSVKPTRFGIQNSPVISVNSLT